MALQFILGSSGSGKSHYIYNKIITDAIKNPRINYILLVPEQYSMSLQRKMVMLHPNGGTMNIDVIGMNRLAYRVFDELNIKSANVLEDFGKTMLLRQVAGGIKDELKVYGGCLNKNGFIDEAKSLMSELYQYDIDKQSLYEVLTNMRLSGERLLADKLSDMIAIFQAFEEKLSGDYIVAEELTELLAMHVKHSSFIKNSVIVMDGFTGFTPIQLNLLKTLMANAKDVFAVLTIDEKSANSKTVREHELFYLSRRTMDDLLAIAGEADVQVKENIVIKSTLNGRWGAGRDDLRHLEENIFRFPYREYKAAPENISLAIYESPRNEINAAAQEIHRLVSHEGLRYKDIAIISGNLTGIEGHVRQVFSRYDIPYFVDRTMPVKNNPYIDAIGHLLRLVNEDFSYDSVFSFLKSGLIKELSDENIEELENYVLSKGIRGKARWKREWKSDVEEYRGIFMETIASFADSLGKRKHKVSRFIDAIKALMDTIHYEEGMADTPELYEGLIKILDRLLLIMADDVMNVDEFKDILDVGLKDLSLGRIPPCIDMVTVGDITRTRLEDIKILFVIGLNDGIIPKSGTPAQIINDSEKEILSEAGIFLAPTEKQNSFIEQFYLYMNMTKPSDKLYLSYTINTDAGENIRPSFIVGRIQRVFPGLAANTDNENKTVSTRKGSIYVLIDGLRSLMEGDDSRLNETLSLYKLYMDMGDEEMLDRIYAAFTYNNIPKRLSGDVAKLIRIRCMSQSVSRIEKYASCAYSYFLRYILGLSERQTDTIDNRQIGTIMHSAMERLFRHVKENLNNDWESLDDCTIDELATKYTYEAFDEECDAEGRNGYLRETLARIGRRTAGIMSAVAKEDLLRPEYFEYRFKEKIDITGGDYYVTINGIVDRGDVYYSPENNSLKLRIIDYKSGRHEFDVSELYEGLSLQLSVYMYIMQGIAKKYNKNANQTTEVIPEGMYYYHMQDPLIDAETIEDADAKRKKKLMLEGIDYSEPAKFDAAVNYSIKKMTEIVDRILCGDIDKNPVKNGNSFACEYCEFKSVCRFDTKCGGNKYRYKKYSKKDADKVFDQILRELGGKTDGVDG